MLAWVARWNASSTRPASEQRGHDRALEVGVAGFRLGLLLEPRERLVPPTVVDEDGGEVLLDLRLVLGLGIGLQVLVEGVDRRVCICLVLFTFDSRPVQRHRRQSDRAPGEGRGGIDLETLLELGQGLLVRLVLVQYVPLLELNPRLELVATGGQDHRGGNQQAQPHRNAFAPSYRPEFACAPLKDWTVAARRRFRGGRDSRKRRLMADGSGDDFIYPVRSGKACAEQTRAHWYRKSVGPGKDFVKSIDYRSQQIAASLSRLTSHADSGLRFASGRRHRQRRRRGHRDTTLPMPTQHRLGCC